MQASPIRGRLYYDPATGIKLELVSTPTRSNPLTQSEPDSITLFGRLVDGTPVTLADCFITSTSVGAGGVDLPTKLLVSRAVFGEHVTDIERLEVTKYAVELSSLANWTCASPLRIDVRNAEGKLAGIDARLCFPKLIRVALPDKDFDVQISHAVKCNQQSCSWTVGWSAFLTIVAHNRMLFRDASDAAWQCQNLMTMLIGHQLSTRSVAIKTLDKDGKRPHPLRLLFHQRGKRECPDVHAAEMLLPYNVVREQFPQIVQKSFARSEQAVLAANVFFGSQLLESPTVNVKFLAAVQAAESYHRALGTGLYMDQAVYDKAMCELLPRIPASIQGDHRISPKNRLKYGNEYPLRKRLNDMLNRVPEDLRLKIAAGDVNKFVGKVVDTRNYYTHYDHTARVHAFEAKDTFIAAERLRILLTAILLQDLDINDQDLLPTFQRNQKFWRWLSQDLRL